MIHNSVSISGRLVEHQGYPWKDVAELSRREERERPDGMGTLLKREYWCGSPVLKVNGSFFFIYF